MSEIHPVYSSYEVLNFTADIFPIKKSQIFNLLKQKSK